MYCRCTQCGTGFALSAEQLRAGRGRVRCGTCLAVFDALQTLSDEFEQLPSADESAARDTAPVALGDLETVAAPATDEQGDTDTDAAPPPAEVNASAAPASTPGDALPGSDASAVASGPSMSSVELPAAPEPGGDSSTAMGHFSRPGRADETDPADADAVAKSSSPSLHADAGSGGGQASLRGLTGAPPSSPAGSSHAGAGVEDDAATLDSLRIVPVDVAAEPPGEERTEPGIGDTRTASAGDRRDPVPGSAADAVPEILREDMARLASARRARRALLGFGAGCVLLTASLLLQWAWFQPEDVLARYPQTRPWMESLCERTGCVLPERRDPSKMRMITRDVRVHPRYEGALRVTASLMNTAPYTQPFPRLHFTLFNVNGQVIASRVFEPAQYLGGDFDPAAEMRPRVPVQVALELIAPEDAAVSFEFDFL